MLIQKNVKLEISTCISCFHNNVLFAEIKMTPTKKRLMTIEQKKELKRERERARRKRIKDDPVQREIQREKERKRYLEKKEKGIVKLIADMTPREQRLSRKSWRINSRNYQMRKDAYKQESLRLREDTPPASDEEINEIDPVQRKLDMRKRILNRNKQRRYQNLKKMEAKIRDLTMVARKLKQRCRRLEQEKATKKSLTLNSTTEVPLSSEDGIGNRVLLGDVIKNQLVESYKSAADNRSKQVIKKIINGPVVKKYRMKTAICDEIKCRRGFRHTNMNIFKFEKKHYQRQQMMRNLRKHVQLFLEQDINSRVCPGKKEYQTKNKVIKQRRYLSNTMRNLHIQFCKKMKISYATFCRCRPFWIVPMKVQDRDTTKCMIHANMELVVDSLYSNNIISEKTPFDVVKKMTCNGEEKCLLRLCKKCEQIQPTYEQQKSDQQIQYFQWRNIKHSYNVKKSNISKTVNKMAKQPEVTTVQELFKTFKIKLSDFLAHEGRIKHQYSCMKNLKKSLLQNEIVIHCDFSENYSLKFAEEVQSFHFGGARQQITLHTVIVYSYLNVSSISSRSFCTLSECLEHNSAAIWAHLFPIIEEYYKKGIEVVHFLSDGPSTQYRNKFMFAFLVTELKKQFPRLKCISWNFNEAGHGKGAVDGVGGTCKRMADRMIAQGKDVPTFPTLMKVLRTSCPGITFYEISSNNIQHFDKIIQKMKTSQFKGTMKVHQVITRFGSQKLWMRSLSCFICETHCSHFHLGVIDYGDSSETSWSSDDNLSLQDLCRRPLQENSNRLRYADVYNDVDSDDSSGANFPNSTVSERTNELNFYDKENGAGCSKPPPVVQKGSYVLVSISKKLSNITHKYVCVCQNDVEDDGEVKIMLLKLSNGRRKVKNQLFQLDEKSVLYVCEEQIIEVLPNPNIVNDGNKVYYKFPKVIEVFEE